MPDELKPVLARQMEVYAGFLEHTDHHVGRVIDAIEDLGVLDNTLIYYIIGDNGASAEGTMNGAFNEMANFNGMAALETPEFMLSKMDEFGSPSSYNHYSVGWAWAMDTPFQWTKQVASHWGGTRNGTIVHWPAGIAEQGGLRTQFTHVIDIAPTILEAAGLPEPTHGQRRAAVAHGGHQHALHASTTPRRPSATTCSTSRCSATAASTTGAGAPSPSTRRHGCSSTRTPSASTTTPGSSTTAATDYSQARNLAADQPERLATLQRLWLIEATQVQRAADGRPHGRAAQPGARRPADPHPRQLAAVLPGHGPPLGEQRRQHQEQVVLRHRRGRGAGGRRRGRAHRPGRPLRRLGLYAKDGRAKFVYNVLGIHEFADRGRHADPGRQAPGADGVRVRRRRPGQGRRRHAVLRRDRRRARAGSGRPSR